MIVFFTFASDRDREVFEYIYERYKNLMLHKAYGILRDYMLAEDAVSEAFIRVYKNLHKIEDPASNQSISFVMTIVRNAALTLLQKRENTAVELEEDSYEDPFDLEQYILSEVSTQAIYGLLEQLSEELRSVFLLKYAHDLSHKEIGKALGISENNVTVRVHRAKKKLSALLVKEGYASEAGR